MLILMELKKAARNRNKGILILSIVIVLLILLLYANYTNTGSSVFESGLCDLTNGISFCILFYGMLFLTIWSSVIGVFLGNYDVNNKTIYNLIVLRGRYVPFIMKILSIFIFHLIFLIVMSIIAGIIAVLKCGWCNINIVIVVSQITFMAFVGFCTSLFAFLISILTQKSGVFQNWYLISIYIIICISMLLIFLNKKNYS